MDLSVQGAVWEQERRRGDCGLMSSPEGEGWMQPVLGGGQEFEFGALSLRCPLDTERGAEKAVGVGAGLG